MKTLTFLILALITLPAHAVGPIDWLDEQTANASIVNIFGRTQDDGQPCVFFVSNLAGRKFVIVSLTDWLATNSDGSVGVDLGIGWAKGKMGERLNFGMVESWGNHAASNSVTLVFGPQDRVTRAIGKSGKRKLTCVLDGGGFQVYEY